MRHSLKLYDVVRIDHFADLMSIMRSRMGTRLPKTVNGKRDRVWICSALCIKISKSCV